MAEELTYTQSAIQNSEFNLSQCGFTQENYHFAGWTTERDGNGDFYEDRAAVTFSNDINLYAQWEPNLYAVTFDRNFDRTYVGESLTWDLDRQEIVNASYGTLVAGLAEAIPMGTYYSDLTGQGYSVTPTNEGINPLQWKFRGWHTSTDSSGETVTAETQVLGDVTYYAHWQRRWKLRLNRQHGDPGNDRYVCDTFLDHNKPMGNATGGDFPTAEDPDMNNTDYGKIWDLAGWYTGRDPQRYFNSISASDGRTIFTVNLSAGTTRTAQIYESTDPADAEVMTVPGETIGNWVSVWDSELNNRAGGLAKCGGIPVLPTTPITTNKILYAHWHEKFQKYDLGGFTLIWADPGYN